MRLAYSVTRATMPTVLLVILAFAVLAVLTVAHLFREHVNYNVQATIRFLKDWKQSRGRLRETGKPIENDEIGFHDPQRRLKEPQENDEYS